MLNFLIVRACACAFTALLLGTFIESGYASGPEHPPVEIRGQELYYRGYLDEDHIDQVEALLASHPEITRLSIGSGGGDVKLGMRLGDLVTEHGLDVRVLAPFCASSCANYVFPSGKRKFIDEGAVVFWHGSPLLPDAASVTETHVDANGNSTTVTYEGESLREYNRRPDVVAGNEKDRLENMEFFARRGVDGRVTIFGHQIECDCNWTFSVEDMAMFGIRDVHSDGEYPQVADWWEDLALERIEISDYPDHFPATRG